MRDRTDGLAADSELRALGFESSRRQLINCAMLQRATINMVYLIHTKQTYDRISVYKGINFADEWIGWHGYDDRA